MADVLPVSGGCDAGVARDSPQKGVGARDVNVGCDVRGCVQVEGVVEFKDPLWWEQLTGWDRHETVREGVFFQQHSQ